MSKAKIPLDIGEARDDELNFVYATWKDSAIDLPQNHARKAFGKVGEHYTMYNALADRVDETKKVWYFVAREPTDPTFAYGWMCAGIYGNTTAIVYAYTKYKFRNLGICSQLHDTLFAGLAPRTRKVYCERSHHDAHFEKWGLKYMPLEELISGKKTTRRRLVG